MLFITSLQLMLVFISLCLSAIGTFLQYNLHSTVVSNLDLALHAYVLVILWNLNFQNYLSLANLVIDVPIKKLWCTVNELSQKFARLVLRKVTGSVQIYLFDCCDAFWLQQSGEDIHCCATVKLVLLEKQFLKASLLLDEFEQIRLCFIVPKPSHVTTKTEMDKLCETWLDYCIDKIFVILTQFLTLITA